MTPPAPRGALGPWWKQAEFPQGAEASLPAPQACLLPGSGFAHISCAKAGKLEKKAERCGLFPLSLQAGLLSFPAEKKGD